MTVGVEGGKGGGATALLTNIGGSRVVGVEPASSFSVSARRAPCGMPGE